MRMEKRYKPKWWFKKWMYWAVVYPSFMFIGVMTLPIECYQKVKDCLYEWDFTK